MSARIRGHPPRNPDPQALRPFDFVGFFDYHPFSMDKFPGTQYKVDQRIVYPSQGVGRIMAIHEKAFKDSKILYYTIYLEFSDM
ncbi:MAG: CarD family transcriptional regulator, partial [Spirochaetota bacterium]